MHQTILFLLLSTLLLPVSCQAAIPNLFVGITTDKATYKQGEPIAMALTVLNQDSKPEQIRFANSKIYDFHLYDEDDQLVWKWSGDKMFAMSLIDLKLESKLPLTYVVTFNQILASGEGLKPGKYQLVGEFCASEKEYRSNPVEIRIRK
jgi:hypothetical protein